MTSSSEHHELNHEHTPRLDKQTQVNMTHTLGLAAVVDILDKHEADINEVILGESKSADLLLRMALNAEKYTLTVQEQKELLSRTITTMKAQQEMIGEHHTRIKNLEGTVDKLMNVLRQI